MTLREFIDLWNNWSINDFGIVDYETGAHYMCYSTEDENEDEEEIWLLGGDRTDETEETLLDKEVAFIDRSEIGEIEIYIFDD